MGATYDDVDRAVREFHEKFPRPGIDDLPERLHRQRLQAPLRGRQTWPLDRVPGVYFLFPEDGYLHYVGSSDDIKQRLHGRSREKGKWPAIVSLAFLPLPDAHWFEARAIEAYLLRKLDPPGNKAGKEDRHTRAARQREEREFLRQLKATGRVVTDDEGNLKIV